MRNSPSIPTACGFVNTAKKSRDTGDRSLFVENLQFLVYDSAKGIFKNTIAIRDVIPESFVDEGLIISTPSIFYLITKKREFRDPKSWNRMSEKRSEHGEEKL